MDKSNFEIFSERVKRPAIFVLVCVAAAVGLFLLEKQKIGFEKSSNAPLIIVDQAYKTEYDNKNVKDKKKFKEQNGFLRMQSSDEVIKKINPPHNDDDEKASRAIIEKCIKAVQFETFKNEDELITKLYEVVKKNKEGETKTLEDRSSFYSKSINEINVSAVTASNELNRIADGNLNINVISNLKTADSPFLKDVLSDIKNKTNEKSANKYEVTQIEEAISKEKTKKLNEAQKGLDETRADVNKIDDKFENIYGFIFKSFKNKRTINEIFEKAEYDEFRKNILDGKNGLSVVYWLIEIILKVIIVFGLLYVILIPLKHIFFIALSLDDVVSHGKKSIEKVGTTALGVTMLTKAIIVTFATVAIGTAVLAGNAFQSEAEETEESADLQTLIRKDANPPTKPDKNNPPRDTTNPKQLEIDLLKASVDKLKEEITTLNGKIGDTDFSEMVTTVKDTKQNTIDLKDVVGIREDPNDKQTILKAVNNFPNWFEQNDKNVAKQLANFTREFNYLESSSLAYKINDISNTLNGNSKTSMDIFGKNTDYNKPQNLLQAVDLIWQTVGTTEYLANKSDPNKSDLKANMFQRIVKLNKDIGENDNSLTPDLTTSLEPQPTTLFGKVNFVQRSIGTPNYVKEKANIYSTLGAIPYNQPNAVSGATPLPTIPSLVQISQSVETETKNIKNSTNDMSRYAFGGDGGGFFQYFNNAFTDKRYVITDFALTTLKTFYTGKKAEGIVNDIKTQFDLGNSSLKNKILSEEDISKTLFPEKYYKDKAEWQKMDKTKWQIWKDNKSEILRYFRIVR